MASASELVQFTNRVIAMAKEEISKGHEHSAFLAEFLAKAMRGEK